MDRPLDYVDSWSRKHFFGVFSTSFARGPGWWIVFFGPAVSGRLLTADHATAAAAEYVGLGSGGEEGCV